MLRNREFATAALLQPANGAIVQAVSQTEGAIGYVGLAYLTQSVKALPVGAKEGGTYLTPSMETARAGTYPITRGLYIYTNGAPKGLAKQFIDFILSKEGQKIAEEDGYVPLK